MPDIDVLAAETRIRPYVKETPVRLSKHLCAASLAQVYLKLENTQESGAFKLRGAANKLLSLLKAEADRGIVTASNGNHALAVASMAGKLGIACEVFVSEHISTERLDKIRAAGAFATTTSGHYVQAEETAREIASRSGRTFVSPYNDPQVIAGQGTIAVELLRQCPRLDAVFVAVGGGGLIGGIGAHLKAASPHTEVVGCWPANSPALYECLRAGTIVEVEERPTLSVSTAGGIESGSITLPLGRRVIDRAVLVNETEILTALRTLFQFDELLVEGAAGVATAALLQVAAEFAGKSVAIIICGGNVDSGLDRLIRAP